MTNAIDFPPVFIPSRLPGNGSLAGNYLPGRTRPDFAVVWVHGFGSHRGGEKAAAVRAACERRGWAFAAFDFRGHGASSGTMHDLRASGLLDDLAAVRDWLADRGHTRLGLVGSSMGGFAAAWFATRHPDSVVGCVLLAPAFGFLARRWDRLSEAERAEWKQSDRLRVKNEWVDVEVGYGLIEERDRFRPADLAANWRTPALIFHGLGDDAECMTGFAFWVRRPGGCIGAEIRGVRPGIGPVGRRHRASRPAPARSPQLPPGGSRTSPSP
jgi:pimeloyl-ACP methyl ester carboxylesterase